MPPKRARPKGAKAGRVVKGEAESSDEDTSTVPPKLQEEAPAPEVAATSAADSKPDDVPRKDDDGAAKHDTRDADAPESKGGSGEADTAAASDPSGDLPAATTDTAAPDTATHVDPEATPLGAEATEEPAAGAPKKRTSADKPKKAPAADASGDGGEKRKRRPTVRTVEVAPTSPKNPAPQETAPTDADGTAGGLLPADPSLTASTTENVPDGDYVVEEDEFGDCVVRRRDPLPDRTLVADASDPRMDELSASRHARELLGFADEDGTTPRDSSPPAHDPAGAGAAAAVPTEADEEDGIGSFIDKVRRRLRSVSIAGSSAPRDHTGEAEDPPRSTEAAAGEVSSRSAEAPLDAALRRLKRASSRKATDVLAHYHPSTHPNRTEQHRIPVGVKLKHELVPPPEAPDLATPPTSLSAPYQQAAAETEAQRLREARAHQLPPLAYALQDVKRVLFFESLRDGQAQLHRHTSAAERRGHVVMQARANAEATSSVIRTITAATEAMRDGHVPLFSAAHTLSAPAM